MYDNNVCRVYIYIYYHKIAKHMMIGTRKLTQVRWDPENRVVSSRFKWNSWFTGKSLLNVLLNSVLSEVAPGFDSSPCSCLGSMLWDPALSAERVDCAASLDPVSDLVSELSVLLLLVENLGVILRGSTETESRYWK